MLISDLPLRSPEVHGDTGRDVTSVSLNSRSVGPGCLFAALPGANVHGVRFVPDVLAAGVRAVLTDPAGAGQLDAVGADLTGVTLIVVEEPRAQLGAVAAAVYGTQREHPALLAVTGTNGKTTTTFILEALLARLHGDERTAVIGTVATRIAGASVPAVRTTPEAPELHALFADMRGAGVDYCAMEVSSHALVQHRVDGAHFRVAGFTNLSQDHLDYHKTMENYFRAKAELFTPEFSDSGVIYLADDWARRLARESPIDVVTVSADPADEPDFLVVADGQDFELHSRRPELASVAGVVGAHSPLPGQFNVANTALALVMLLRLGVSAQRIAEVAHDWIVHVPGRMEVVRAQHPQAIVDFSHTPDALAKVLDSLRGGVSGPLVVVVGAGGDRDRSKRAAMGRVVAQLADVVIITDDNPRSEDPAAIRAAVLSGAREWLAEHPEHPVELREIGDRSAAIAAGVGAAGTCGTVLVAGKGHETGQEINGVKHHFDDREETRIALPKATSDA